jgi:hypothetical protein
LFFVVSASWDIWVTYWVFLSCLDLTSTIDWNRKIDSQNQRTRFPLLLEQDADLA